MKEINYHQPTEIRFGKGRIKEIGKVVNQFGERCLLVTMRETGIIQKIFQEVKGILKDEGIKVFHYDGVVPNPTTDCINTGALMAINNKVEVVLGVGGGSSMDTAKAIAVGATHKGQAWDYRLFSNEKITEKCLPIITVTTTSGTGSQVTPVSVVTNSAKKSKFALVDKLLCPKVSIIDPDLMLTIPEHITASTGFDVFAHAFESYIHKNASVYTDLLAEEAIRLVVDYLPVVLEDGTNIEARSKMAWADTLAGLCIANAGTTLPHGIGMAIGGHAPHVMHGEALAVIYPEFMQYTWQSSIKKFATIARILNPTLSDFSDRIVAKKSCQEIISFLKRINMYFTFNKLGVPEEELSAIADDSVKLPDYKVNPRVATRDEIFNMLTRS